MVNPDENYQISFNSDNYSLTSSTVPLKVTLIRADGEPLTAEDKEGWTLKDNSGILEQKGNTTFTTKGVGTLTLTRINPVDLSTGTSMIKLIKDGAIYASVPVNYSPIATITTDSSDKLLTDGAETVTALKINGVAVDLSEYTISSVNSDAAIVEVVENNIQITPLQPGQAIFRVYKNEKYAEAKITFYIPSAQINGTYYKTLANAFKAAQNGDTIVLNNDTTESISFSGTAPRAQEFAITFDLNGHTLKGNASSSYALRVDYGEITVKDSVGTGGIEYGKDYAFLVSHLAGNYPSKLIIESGNFTGKTSVLQAGYPGGSGSNYKYYGGDAIIKGGVFNIVPDTNETYDSNGNFKYGLNMLDMNESAYAGGIYSPSSILVEGGKFYKFNPADNLAEGSNTNFVADGFKSEKNGDWYEIIPE